MAGVLSHLTVTAFFKEPSASLKVSFQAAIFLPISSLAVSITGSLLATPFLTSRYGAVSIPLPSVSARSVLWCTRPILEDSGASKGSNLPCCVSCTLRISGVAWFSSTSAATLLLFEANASILHISLICPSLTDALRISSIKVSCASLRSRLLFPPSFNSDSARRSDWSVPFLLTSFSSDFITLASLLDTWL